MDWYPGVWLTRTSPHLAYRALPKCGCSSVGQVIHFLDHGKFFEGDVRTAQILKRKTDAQSQIAAIMSGDAVLRFTFVRNPYKRLLSCFADKIFGFQDNGRRYRGGVVHTALLEYGVAWGPKSKLIANFRRFVRFVADTIERREPMPPDLHWSPCLQHLAETASYAADWSLDFVGQLEHFQRDLDEVIRRAGIDPQRVPGQAPRANTTSLPRIPITRLYGPDEVAIVQRVYAQDFRLLGYGEDPANTSPIAQPNVARINDWLRNAANDGIFAAAAAKRPADGLRSGTERRAIMRPLRMIKRLISP